MLDCRNGLTAFVPGSKTGSLLYTYNQLRSQDFVFFDSLAVCDTIEINGIQFEIAHGFKDDDRFYFDGTDANTETVLEQMKFFYFLGGHCHRQYIRQAGDKTILNPGSVGVPRDYGYLTQYALLDFSAQDIHIELRQIPYDVSATIHSQFQSGLADIAPHWAISVLYDVITGQEYTLELLEQLEPSDAYDEAAWHCIAASMGMKFTEDEILDCCKELESF